MKKSVLFAAGLAIIVLVVIALILSNSNSGSPVAQSADSSANSDIASGENSGQASDGALSSTAGSSDIGSDGAANANANTAKTHSIEIVDFSFTPLTLTINRGDTVLWTNSDSAKHTVTSNSGSELDSELFGKDESYSHTFNTKGTFKYHCTPHPGMTGLVQVV